MAQDSSNLISRSKTVAEALVKSFRDRYRPKKSILIKDMAEANGSRRVREIRTTLFRLESRWEAADGSRIFFSFSSDE